MHLRLTSKVAIRGRVDFHHGLLARVANEQEEWEDHLLMLGVGDMWMVATSTGWGHFGSAPIVLFCAHMQFESLLVYLKQTDVSCGC